MQVMHTNTKAKLKKIRGHYVSYLGINITTVTLFFFYFLYTILLNDFNQIFYIFQTNQPTNRPTNLTDKKNLMKSSRFFYISHSPQKSNHKKTKNANKNKH